MYEHAICLISVCFVACFTSHVKSYGHCGVVSSPNHTFLLGKLDQAVNQYFVEILSLVTDSGREENDRKNISLSRSIQLSTKHIQGYQMGK